MSKFFKDSIKGITLITLVVAVSIMIIISSLLIYNARTGIKVRNYKMLQNDIELLDDKVSAYYMKYGALPVEIKYNVNPLPFESVKNPNDNENYYVLDLKVFEGLTLNYGADYDKVTESNVADFTDLYIINEQSHQIYYAKGIEMDGVMYYTNDTAEEVSVIDTLKWVKGVINRDGVIGLDNKGDVYTLDIGYNGYPENNINIVEISSYMMHLLAIDNNGKVYAYGTNLSGELGNGTDASNNKLECISNIKSSALYGKKIVEISSGISHSVAIDSEEKVYSWGNNELGQLGNGTNESSSIPICISDQENNILNGKKIVKISTGYANTVAIDEEGKVYIWGLYDFSIIANSGSIENAENLPCDFLPVCLSEQDNILKDKKIIDITCGGFYILALDEQGKVYTWGLQNYTSYENGNQTELQCFDVPICLSEQDNNILKDKKIIKISSGMDNKVALDEQGKVYTWGNNMYGQLGNGTNEDSNTPICITEQSENALNGKKIINIISGISNTLFIDDKNNTYMCGMLENQDIINEPQNINDIEYYNGLSGKKIINIGMVADGASMGSIYNIFLDDNGKLYKYIDNSISEFEVGETPKILEGKNIIDISSEYNHAVALDKEGKVYTWGNNSYGQLGNGTNLDSNLPICISDQQNVLNGKKITKILALDDSTVVLDSDGKVYTWGYNYYGQLGNGTNLDSNLPVCISDQENVLKGKKIVEISIGLALDSDGKVYTWGYNRDGQLGNGTNLDSNLPICISDQENNILNGKKITKILALYHSTVVLDSDGKVYTWGNNSDGQLGNGTYSDSNLPICISDQQNVLNGKKIVEISSEYTHIVALDEEGKVYTWGNNYFGQLGNGTNVNSNLPICISNQQNVLNGTKIIKISVGALHTIVIDEEGKVYTWGDNYDGALGNGESGRDVYSNIPICISNIEGNILKNVKVCKLSSKEAANILIDFDGQMYTFGKTSAGR